MCMCACHDMDIGSPHIATSCADVKLYDLRSGRMRFEDNVGNGVVGLEFDRCAVKLLRRSCRARQYCVARLCRPCPHTHVLWTRRPQGAWKRDPPAYIPYLARSKDIAMNNLVVTSLESQFCVYDVRTQHPKAGFASVRERAHKATVWLARHLPSNRDIWVTTGGNGGINLYR